MDPRGRRDFHPGDLAAPVFCNKYAIDELKRESMHREPNDRDRGDKYQRSRSMPRQQRRGSDIGIYDPPTIVEPRALHTLQPNDRGHGHFEHKQFLSPPAMDDHYLDMPAHGRRQHRRKDRGSLLLSYYYIFLKTCILHIPDIFLQPTK